MYSVNQPILTNPRHFIIDNDEKSDKAGEEKQEEETGEITTVNQVF
jgi:hypothetical protein